MSETIPGQNSCFEQDVKAYVSALPHLLRSSEGKFALVGNAALTEIYESREAAMRDGYASFGERGFLVQRIDRHDLEMSLHWSR